MYNAKIKNNRVVAIDDDGNEVDVCDANDTANSPYSRRLTVTWAEAAQRGLQLATNDDLVPYVNCYSGVMSDLTA